MLRGANVQSRAPGKCLTGEAHNGTVPDEGQAGDFPIGQFGKHLGLFQGDAQFDQHFEFTRGYILGRKSGEGEIPAIEFGRTQRIVVPLLCTGQKLSDLSSAVIELAKTDRGIPQVLLLIRT